MRKGKLAFALAMVALMSPAILPVSVSAEDITTPIGIAPFYAYTSSISNTLSITSKTATCNSIVTGLSSATKIQLYQYLEKENGGYWTTIDAWNVTTTSSRASLSKTTSNLVSGSYRLRTVAYVYSGSNCESVTKTSSTVIV